MAGEIREAEALHQIQVKEGAYGARYMTLPRMVTHWHQANSIAKLSPQGCVLEIGPGSGHTTWLLRKWGIDVKTLDFDPRVGADIVADITRTGLPDGAFDCILAAEVLEHLPFEEFDLALSELYRIARRNVVITLPAPFLGISALINMPKIKPFGLFFGIPFRVDHQFDGEHYWELGKRGYSKSKILKHIRLAGFKIIETFRPAPSVYCLFIVLSK